MQAQKSRRQQGALIHQYSRQSAGDGERGGRNNLSNLILFAFEFGQSRNGQD
jgi:hypothetical protein